MAASNGFPNLTTAGQGLFNGASSVGMIQGQADPDPATRFALRAGIVSTVETVPMWGGIGVEADIAPISATGPNQVLGQVLKRAASLATLLGFTVFDQGYNMVTDPSNPVPTAGSGQSINYYPLGCRARIAVACDPALVSLRSGAINQQVSWDYQAQMLIPYSATHGAGTITGAVWSNTAGGQIDFTVSTDLTADINAGDDIEVANVVNTGGSSTGAFNGQWTVVSISATHIVVSAPASASLGTYASGGNVLAGGGALPVTVLDVQPTGCITVDDTGGLYTYNYSGACAKIQLTGGTTA
jgi:hypothetical protein